MIGFSAGGATMTDPVRHVNNRHKLMIGDPVEQDVLGPMRAGIRAIWFNWKQENYSGTASFQTIGSLREVPAVIEAV
jgi:FMN phosphatase YigB (HAD superfamily)